MYLLIVRIRRVDTSLFFQTLNAPLVRARMWSPSAENTTKIGKILNAQKVIVGSISKIFDTYYITANMVDVESGRIESASSGDCSNVGELKSVVKKVGFKLFKQ